MPENDFTLALKELRAARERHCAVVTSPEHVVGHSIAIGARTIRDGVLTVAKGIRKIGARPKQGVLQHTYEWFFEAHPINPRMMYEVRIQLKSVQRDVDAACLLTIEYQDLAGHPLAWEETGGNFSKAWGFYRYLPASQDGRINIFSIEPPEGSSTVRFDIVRWDPATTVVVEDVSLKAIDASRNEQLAHYQQFLGTARTLEDVTLVVDPASIANATVEAALRDGASVIYVYADRSTAPAVRDRLFLVSRSLFNTEYQSLAAVGSGSRHLVLTDASFSSILQANFFRYFGWQVRLLTPGDASTLRWRHLRAIGDNSQSV